MLTKKDIALLKGMFDDVKTEMRDEFHSCIAASEARLTVKIDRLDKKIDHVAEDTAELIGNSILPQIAELQHEDIRIKKFVGMI